MIVVSDERFPVTWSGRTAVVGVPGEVDLTNSESLRDELLNALNAGAVGLVVDMTGTTFCDSAGIAALTRAARRVSGGSPLTLVTMVAARSRSFTFEFCETLRSNANALFCGQ